VLHTIKYLLPDIAISPDGRWLAVSRHGWDSEPVEGSVQVGNMVLLYDIGDPDNLRFKCALKGKFLEKTSLDFSPDSRWLAAGSASGGAHVWDLAAKDLEASLRVSPISAQLLHGIAFSPDGRWLGLGGSDGGIHLWEWQIDHRVRTITKGNAAHSLTWLSDSRLASGGQGGRVAIWETDIEHLTPVARKAAGRELEDDEWARFRRVVASP
jgi:WD40 repeat protein